MTLADDLERLVGVGQTFATWQAGQAAIPRSIAALRAAEALVAAGPPWRDEFDTPCCVYCTVAQFETDAPHEPDCPWAALRDALSGGGEG